jgi:hypothetical protein
MIGTGATAEIFWTAFQVLPRAEQQAVLRKLIQNEDHRHDLMDLALIEERKDEPGQPFRDYLKEAHQLAWREA